MLLTYTKAQYDALPEAQQKLCSEKDGSYTFEFQTSAEVAGLTKNKDDLLEELKKTKKAAADAKAAAEADAAKYKDIDPMKYAEMMKAAADSEHAALENKGQWQVLEQKLKDAAAQKEKQLVDAHAKAVKQLEDRNASLSSALESKLIDAEAVAALSKHTKAVELLMPHVKNKVKVFEEEGKYIAKVLDKDGNPRISDAQGTLMTIEQLVEEMKASDIFGRAFDASGAGGSGASGSNGGAGNSGRKTITRTAFDILSVPERDAKMKDGFAVVDG